MKIAGPLKLDSDVGYGIYENVGCVQSFDGIWHVTNLEPHPLLLLCENLCVQICLSANALNLAPQDAGSVCFSHASNTV